MATHKTYGTEQLSTNPGATPQKSHDNFPDNKRRSSLLKANIFSVKINNGASPQQSPLNSTRNIAASNLDSSYKKENRPSISGFRHQRHSIFQKMDIESQGGSVLDLSNSMYAVLDGNDKGSSHIFEEKYKEKLLRKAIEKERQINAKLKAGTQKNEWQNEILNSWEQKQGKIEAFQNRQNQTRRAKVVCRLNFQ